MLFINSTVPAWERKAILAHNISRGDIILDTDTKQFGVVSGIQTPWLSFQSHPYRQRPRQIKARMIECLYMGSLWADAWVKLADYGIRDPRMTLNAEHKWIDCFKYTQNAYIQWLDKDYSVNVRRLSLAFQRIERLTGECEKAGLWDDTLKSLRSTVAEWERDFQRLEDDARWEYENSEEYQLRVAETY